MLDIIHRPSQQMTNLNAYELNELNGHHIVIAYLPDGVNRMYLTATVVYRTRSGFPGVCGAVDEIQRHGLASLMILQEARIDG
jgi:hypothetical protein